MAWMNFVMLVVAACTGNGPDPCEGPDCGGAGPTETQTKPGPTMPAPTVDTGAPRVPFVQQHYLKAPNTDDGDEFGSSVAMYGDTLVVGARFEASGATGVAGDLDDNSAMRAGAVYVYARQGDAWILEAYLKPSNTGFGDRFGTSVAIYEDTLVVGAVGERSSARGVNGDELNDDVLLAGAAYVFVRDNGVWQQQAYLKASNTPVGGDDRDDRFGASVAVWMDTIVVGAEFEDSSDVGVNGNGELNNSPTSGAAYVFVREADTWRQEAYLKASTPDSGDGFGTAVAISGERIAVGAPGEDASSRTIDGPQWLDTAGGSGAVYVFVRETGTWRQEAYLKASNSTSGVALGGVLAFHGNTLLVGAQGEASDSVGVNGYDQPRVLLGNSGAAYIFVHDAGVWSQQAYLKADNRGASDLFGNRVAVHGDTAVVGAIWEASSAIGINGDGTLDDLRQGGAAYVFQREGETWSQTAYLKASNADFDDEFGSAVAVGDAGIAVSARLEDSSATGLDGDQTLEDDDDSGAVYLFESVESR